MGLVISVAVGMILWILAWSIGLNGFDGFILFLLVVLVAATVRSVMKLLPGDREAERASPDAAPFT